MAKDLLGFLTDALNDDTLREAFYKNIKEGRMDGQQLSTWLNGGPFINNVKYDQYLVPKECCDALIDLYKAHANDAVPYVITPKY